MGYYSDYLNVNWTCAWCLLPFRYTNLFLNSLLKAHVRVMSETEIDESIVANLTSLDITFTGNTGKKVVVD